MFEIDTWITAQNNRSRWNERSLFVNTKKITTKMWNLYVYGILLWYINRQLIMYSPAELDLSTLFLNQHKVTCMGVLYVDVNELEIYERLWGCCNLPQTYQWLEEYKWIAWTGYVCTRKVTLCDATNAPNLFFWLQSTSWGVCNRDKC